MTLMARRWVPLFAVPLLGLSASLFVIFDPVLADLVPRRYWILVGAEQWRIRLIPLLLVGPLALAVAVRGLPAYLAAFIASLQMNGLRLGPIDTVDLALFFGVAAVAARIVNRPDRTVRLGIVGNIALFLVLIALPHLIVQSSVVRFGLGWIGLIRAFLAAFVLINLIETRDQLRIVLKIFVAVAAISAAIGIVQFAASFLAGINVTLIDPPETAFKPTPIGMVMRSSGLCITAQHQSGFLVLALPFALWRATTSLRPADLVSVALIGVGLLLTWNMGAILAGAAAGAAFILFRWPSLAVQTAITAALALTLSYYFGGIDWVYDQVFNAGVVKGVSQRSTLLAIGLEKLDRNVLVGTGPQGFASFSGNFWGRPVHNTYLQIATELGLVAALAFAAALMVLMTALVLTLQRVRDSHDQAMLLCMILALGTFLAIIMSEPMMDHYNTWFFLAIVQVSLFVLSKQSPRAEERSWTIAPPLPRLRGRPGKSATPHARGA